MSIVKMIVQGNIGEALVKLSEKFKVEQPKIRVGTVKGHRKAYAVFHQSDKTIYVSNREFLHNPMIVLHEYYHYLQTELYGKKGNEKSANKFAKDFII
ncbi:hypothetical protein AC481_04070 [miscellaneous Crenarchaeota group archaeon SMTZ-80]|nr:MAG: hypothetical protein AC481_04070 [miscellaneous Crenarchaeota group archaeon SMTZ-80]